MVLFIITIRAYICSINDGDVLTLIPFVGVDLLVHVIPAICKAYPHVSFIVGGDGPKRVELEQVREQEGLMDRVTMLGSVPHHLVRTTVCMRSCGCSSPLLNVAHTHVAHTIPELVRKSVWQMLQICLVNVAKLIME